MSGKHSDLAPSDAKRWAHCAASIYETHALPNEDSEYSKEGTRAHDLAAKWLKGDIKAMPNDEDMANGMGEWVAVYTNAIRREAEGNILLVEQNLDVERYTGEKGGGGTGDAIIVNLAAKRIIVNDLKYGEGVLVYAEENEQMILYALGALAVVEDLLGEIDEIEMVIHQVRRDHIDSWTCSKTDLLAYGEKLRQAGELALAIRDGKVAVKPEHYAPAKDTCRWCGIRKTCKAREGVVIDAVFQVATTVDGEFPDLTKPKDFRKAPPTPALLAMIAEWCKDAMGWIEEQFNAGQKVPGWKRVLGDKGDRAWTDEEAVDKEIKKLRIKTGDAYTEKLKSPAQLEKSIPDAEWQTINKKKVRVDKKWKRLEPFIGRSDAKPKLVADTDPRPAIDIVVDDEFKTLI